LLGLIDRDSGLEHIYPSYSPMPSMKPSISRNPGSPLEAVVARWCNSADSLKRWGISGGSSRLATAVPDDRQASVPNRCRRCGLCHHGCPFDAIFSSSRLIDTLDGHSDYRYLSDQLVLGFSEGQDGVTVYTRDGAGSRKENVYDRLVLAAGALSSLRICADSLSIYESEAPLLDNDMFVVPLLLSEIPTKGWKSSFTLSEAVMALRPGVASEFRVHIQFYLLNDSFVPSVFQWMRRYPVFERLVNRVAIAFIYLNGAESRQACILPRSTSDEIAELEIRTQSGPRTDVAKRILRHLEEARHSTGLRPLSAFLRRTPLGFSGHLAGTLPMVSGAEGNHPRMHTEADGRIVGTRHVYVADASTFPSLPAQNPTYTAMANAIRVASILS